MSANFDPQDFQSADISNVDYDTQVLFFNVIKEEVATLNLQEEQLPEQVFAELYEHKLMDIVEMAAGGIVPAQDYLCYTYKKGIPGILPRNLVRAHYWGLIATSNGSKLAVERMRLFYEPVYEYVLKSQKVDDIVSKNNLDSDNITEFIAQNFAILFCEMGKVSLLDVAKKPLIEDDNFVKFSHEAEAVREKVMPRLLELIA